jgi:hypothetical protein
MVPLAYSSFPIGNDYAIPTTMYLKHRKFMIKQLRDDELKIVAEIIRDHIFVPSFSLKKTVFLCGADLSDSKTGRHKMAKLLMGNKRYELLYPEDLFDDLISGQGQHSLLDLENILAESVDAIVLFPESPGSFAELGAFANNQKLARKLICVCQKKFSKNKSFINYGPVRLIKASGTGKVFNIVYNDLKVKEKNSKIYKRINNAIAAIKKKHPITKDVANILETGKFILPCVYLIDSITPRELYKLVRFATGRDKRIAEIATRASISRLIKENLICKTQEGYEVTSQGIDRVRSDRKSANLDVARIEIINSQQRKKTLVKAVNF